MQHFKSFLITSITCTCVFLAASTIISEWIIPYYLYIDVYFEMAIIYLSFVFHQETLVFFKYDEVLSTRNLRTEAGHLFLDLKCGDLMVQKVTRLETPRVCF